MPRIIKKYIVFALTALCVFPPVVFSDTDAGLPVPPNGFMSNRNGIEHGNVSGSLDYGPGQVVVYTPPGYSDQVEYPVFYLLHGYGDDETGWVQKGSTHYIMDNLIADGLAIPMVVVMPNGNQPDWDSFQNSGLINDLIPWVEANYSVSIDPQLTAIAGLSWGAGQTYNIAYRNLDIFTWIGTFSPAPNTPNPNAQNGWNPDPNEVSNNVNLNFLAVGIDDGFALDAHALWHDPFFHQNNIDHIYQLEHQCINHDCGHEWTVWSRSLYNFAQRIFTGTTPVVKGTEKTRLYFSAADNELIFPGEEPKNLKIYDAKGTLIKKIDNLFGHRYRLDGLGPNIYFVHVKANTGTGIQPIVVDR